MILETMTPLDFMDFRNYLRPASGFQSLQFRLLENKTVFGDDPEAMESLHKARTRAPRSHRAVAGAHSGTEHARVQLLGQVPGGLQPALLALIERWLERTPGLNTHGFNFWGKFQAAVDRMIHDDIEAGSVITTRAPRSHRAVAGAHSGTEHARVQLLWQVPGGLQPALLALIERWLERTPGLNTHGFNFWGKFQAADAENRREIYRSIFDPAVHDALRSRGERRYDAH
ncbi:Vermilion [Operophtera brumata]|uniref:Vermilion n=1 Tax=Operophtera brumata TaxID=104452 RepID=A0A0L7KG83_OPEBR|nr:Vermilion [Operophtera brumata]